MSSVDRAVLLARGKERLTQFRNNTPAAKLPTSKTNPRTAIKLNGQQTDTISEEEEAFVGLHGSNSSEPTTATRATRITAADEVADEDEVVKLQALLTEAERKIAALEVESYARNKLMEEMEFQSAGAMDLAATIGRLTVEIDHLRGENERMGEQNRQLHVEVGNLNARMTELMEDNIRLVAELADETASGEAARAANNAVGSTARGERGNCGHALVFERIQAGASRMEKEVKYGTRLCEQLVATVGNPVDASSQKEAMGLVRSLQQTLANINTPLTNIGEEVDPINAMLAGIEDLSLSLHPLMPVQFSSPPPLQQIMSSPHTRGPENDVGEAVSSPVRPRDLQAEMELEAKNELLADLRSNMDQLAEEYEELTMVIRQLESEKQDYSGEMQRVQRETYHLIEQQREAIDSNRMKASVAMTEFQACSQALQAAERREIEKTNDLHFQIDLLSKRLGEVCAAHAVSSSAQASFSSSSSSSSSSQSVLPPASKKTPPPPSSTSSSSTSSFPSSSSSATPSILSKDGVHGQQGLKQDDTTASSSRNRVVSNNNNNSSSSVTTQEGKQQQQQQQQPLESDAEFEIRLLRGTVERLTRDNAWLAHTLFDFGNIVKASHAAILPPPSISTSSAAGANASIVAQVETVFDYSDQFQDQTQSAAPTSLSTSPYLRSTTGGRQNKRRAAAAAEEDETTGPTGGLLTGLYAFFFPDYDGDVDNDQYATADVDSRGGWRHADGAVGSAEEGEEGVTSNVIVVPPRTPAIIV